MLRFTVIFAAITVSREVYSIPAQELDLKDILQFAVRDSYQNRKYKDNKKYQYNNNNYDSLKNQDVVELMQKAPDDKLFTNEYRDADELLKELNNNYKKRKVNKVTFGHYHNKDKDYDKNIVENEEDNEFNDNDERYKHSRFNEQALDELLSKNNVNRNLQSKLKSLVVPSSVVESLEFNNDRNDNNNQDEYSKIYVVLNPQAIEKSENKEKLNNLLARILSLTSLAQETSRKKRNKAQRHKGFSVEPGLISRRLRHDSREMYGKDSMEDDYKPKRMRGDRGSGGGVGGSGGRTAIPYIRNRGDIYERDH